MALSNTSTHYGGVTKTFHWLTALLILTLIPLGIYANWLPYETSEQLAQKAWMFSLHKTLGVTVFFVALARILWALSQPKPTLLHPDRKLESLAAETVHWLLYGSLLLVPLSGWVHHAATDGFAPIWWPLGQNLPFVPKSESLASTAAGLHIVFERVLAASVILHIAGALKHHIIDKDATLLRMLPGRPAVLAPLTPHHVAVPLVSALVIWGGALGIGSTLGLYEKHTVDVAAAELEAVQSDWIVQEGEMAITVKQLGSDVTGSFADWTAAITFDENVTEGPAGTVDVTISIGSLTLGSVTGQAMGADFFNAETFPTATYTADLIRRAGGYTADGTLTIKDQSVPVSFPFDLQIADGVATVRAETSLDRRNYSIGNSQTDEASLGFSVGVTITLTATQGDIASPDS
ncbi:cytochrome b/b6 domain-containing protein [Roseobacter sinensis]|uniref:Cytochrome b/b6 domain-containing protein n=1 Tax=Roseobacter sinensis TaxID=2931391 RepID=A0ABT3BC41_9RHOB|nr:cytochrome b/b6 domain-containing protein [Roseobacter sp. WL0113]MCV3271151.1 cytochrome b/b6 domain-containing protein [Roseobacter sp. WL0113]